MTKFSYKNIRNEGKEVVVVDGKKITIQSDWGRGFMAPVQVTRDQVEMTLKFTGAPTDVFNSVMALVA